MASSTAPGYRPYNTRILFVFALLAIGGAWFMRIAPAIYDVPVGFADLISSGTLPNGVRFKKHYTGIGPLDHGLSFLVAAFLYGPTGWNERFYWQQLHFLLQITPLIAIMNIEACRTRNQGSWLKYTAGFAFLYQNFGGAVLIPIWWLLFHRISADKSYFSAGREVPLLYAQTILPATLLIYFVPTVCMFIPNLNIITVQNILAFWQLAPVFVNIPLWIVSPFVSSQTPSATTKPNKADMKYLKATYIVFLITSIATHWYTVYGISESQDPTVSYASVWVPSTYKWKNSLSDGLLYIFQCDWLVVAAACAFPAFIAIYDVQRLRFGQLTLEQFTEAIIVVVVTSWVAGPGAGISLVWYWREEKLGLLEVLQGAEGLKKGQ